MLPLTQCPVRSYLMPISEHPTVAVVSRESSEQSKRLSSATNAALLFAPSLPAELQRTLDETELSLAMCAALCPYCGKVNTFPGFSEMIAYTCQECGRAVESDDES